MKYKKVCADIFEELLRCQERLHEDLSVFQGIPEATLSMAEKLGDVIDELDVVSDILDAIIGSRLDDGREVFYAHWWSLNRPFVKADVTYRLDEAESTEDICSVGRLIDGNMLWPLLVSAKMAEHATDEKLSEMGKLAVLLHEEKIPFEFSLCQNELRICSPTAENTVVDAVCNRTSQGWSSGLLEVWRQDTCDEPVGCLRAEDALKHFEPCFIHGSLIVKGEI